jgi:hypothetical protein
MSSPPNADSPLSDVAGSPEAVILEQVALIKELRAGIAELERHH